MLVVTHATVVIHVPCDAVHPAVGLGFLVLFPIWLISFRGLLRQSLLFVSARRWSIIATTKAVIWAVWASVAEEKALASSEMSDVDAVVREGGWEASYEVIPWKLAENPADPVVSAVSRRYFSALYMKQVNSDQDASTVWSAQSRSAISNIPDLRMFSISIWRIVNV